MIEYRKLNHEDYQDVFDMCKDIWDGTDYLPQIFHKWVDDRGLFLGAVDTDTGKVIGADKYSVLYDGTGWLEGLRTHKDYRGIGIGKELGLLAFEKAKQDLKAGLIDKIAFSTHISAVESITMMKHLGFILEQGHIFVQKGYAEADTGLSPGDFKVESWTPSYEEFTGLDYLRRRDGLLPFVFYFQKPTPQLYSELLEDRCFLSINGHKGLFKLKGEPHFIVFDESLEGIDTYMNHYLLLLGGKCTAPPMTSVLPEDTGLIEALKSRGYGALEPWIPDYLYFTYR